MVNVPGVGLIPAPAHGKLKTPLGDVSIFVDSFKRLKELGKELKRRDSEILDAVIAVGLSYPQQVMSRLPPLSVVDPKAEEAERNANFAKSLGVLYDRGEWDKVKKAKIGDDFHFYRIMKVLSEASTPNFLGEYATLKDDTVPMKLTITCEFYAAGRAFRTTETPLENPEKYGLSPQEVLEIVDQTIEEAQR
jgi:hypothetical protein